jgi:hypothetical protein
MEFIIEKSEPQLNISYDPIYQSINAQFSFPYPQELTYWEKEAIKYIEQEFLIATDAFVNKMVNESLFRELAYCVRQILHQAYQITGVKIILNDAGLR